MKWKYDEKQNEQRRKMRAHWQCGRLIFPVFGFEFEFEFLPARGLRDRERSSNAEGRFPGQSKINALQIDGTAVVRPEDRQLGDGLRDRMSLIVDLSY